jgi:Icc-related predicted phosphoesterase
MIIDCIGCLHGNYPKLEGGDLLIVTGDLTARDDIDEYIYFVEWLNYQKYKKKIVISGNHDNLVKDHLKWKDDPPTAFEYLCDSGTEFEGLKIWGSPWTSTFEGMNPHCMAFTCDSEENLEIKWARIPDDIDILITHSPPYGILDGIPIKYDGTMFHVGSPSLREHVMARI